MTRFFWKYRYINFFLLLFAFIFCCLNITKIKVFFDSERIIELSNVEKDIIEKSVDDSNLFFTITKNFNYIHKILKQEKQFSVKHKDYKKKTNLYINTKIKH